MNHFVLASVLVFLLTGCKRIAISQNISTLNESEEACMEELGCFPITDDFRSLRYRPINVLPDDRATINTQFLLYTRQNAKEPQRLIANESQTFEKSNLNPNDQTIFIVFGFLESFILSPWIWRMRDEYLIHGDYNIVIVDWRGGNGPPYYRACANARVAGAEIALIVEAMEKYNGIRSENVHLIGHSLGVHVAAYAGKRLKTLGRITGCDPAHPYFQNMPPSVRLDISDAAFVDVIATDASETIFQGLGMSQQVGHINFFPNNGRDQPGCLTERITSILTDSLAQGVKRFFICDHLRSVDYFLYSINYDKATPVAYECTEWQDFLDGKCAECGSEIERCAIMGMRAHDYYQNRNTSVPGTFYLKTGPRPPFWIYHYQVNIKLYEPQTSYKDVKGTIDVTLFGSKAYELFHVQTEAIDLQMGALYQYLVTTESELGEIRNVSLEWYSASINPINLIRKPNLYVEYISVIPMNVIERSPRNMTDRVFCDEPSEGIIPKTTVNFRRDNACLNLL